MTPIRAATNTELKPIKVGRLLEGLRLPWSQIYGLGANVFIPRLEGAPRDDVDSDAQEFLKILEQADVIKKRGAWLEVHEQRG